MKEPDKNALTMFWGAYPRVAELPHLRIYAGGSCPPTQLTFFVGLWASPFMLFISQLYKRPEANNNYEGVGGAGAPPPG